MKLGAGSEMEGISYQLEAVYNEQNSNLEIEPNDSSQDITFSSLPLRKVGSLGEIEDRDNYRFEVLNSSVLELELTSISQGLIKLILMMNLKLGVLKLKTSLVTLLMALP